MLIIIVGTILHHSKHLGTWLTELIPMNMMGSAWGIDKVQEGSHEVVRHPLRLCLGLDKQSCVESL